MDAKPNRRWLQYNLRTLLIAVTLAALSLGWWRHREYCLAQAESHWWEYAVYQSKAVNYKRDRGVPRLGTINSKYPEEERLSKLAEQHRKTSAAFRLAVWLPWLAITDECTPCEIVWRRPQSQ